MIIDAHIHVGDLRTPENFRRQPVTWEGTITRLSEEGIDKAVFLPEFPSPEGINAPWFFCPQPDLIGQLKKAAEYPDHIIIFGNLDPRMNGNHSRADFRWILERFIELGCVGIGEVTPNMEFDDPRVINMFRQCGQYDLPVTIHAIGTGEGHYGLYDDPGSPRLERLLQACPDTIILGHGQGFWAEIGAGITPEGKSSYPKGPVTAEGSLPRLLRTYPNLYGDISAGSGYNALTRDPEFGLRFIEEFQDRLLFGTDVCFGELEGRMPHLGFLRRLLMEGKISRAIFDKMTSGNLLRLLKRYKG
jgi:predicted TIM-barrel fold metal-dependent hydrolase